MGRKWLYRGEIWIKKATFVCNETSREGERETTRCTKKQGIEMDSKIPAYLYGKSNTVKMILFTALFALLFINLFQPFGSRNWYPGISDITYFAFSSFIILTGMLVVVISRVILNTYSKKHDILYWQYAVWIGCEIVAMASSTPSLRASFPRMA